jgi:hypothetical protein
MLKILGKSTKIFVFTYLPVDPIGHPGRVGEGEEEQVGESPGYGAQGHQTQHQPTHHGAHHSYTVVCLYIML